MIDTRTRGREHLSNGSAMQLWTVVSVVEDCVSCTIHSSEYQAYYEAVSQFESAEVGDTRRDLVLKGLLAVANTCGDYQEVRAYIAANSRRMQLMQLSEHCVNDISSYKVRAPRLA